MLLIAKKKGYFVLVVWVLSYLVCYLVNEYFIKSVFVIDPIFIWGTALVISGIITFIIRPERNENDQAKRSQIETDNTFFFIPMRYWSYMELLFGIALLILGALKFFKVLR
jgi:hypothetical protein